MLFEVKEFYVFFNFSYFDREDYFLFDKEI